MEFAFYSATFDTLSMFIVYQLNSRIIFPKLIKQTRRYLLVSFLIIFLFSLVFYLIDVNFIPRLPCRFRSKQPHFFHFMRVFFTTSFVYFVATSRNLFVSNQRLIENERLLNKEKLETELKLLKAQINPHFIFNALNNIYSLTYMRAKNAPEAVLKLSEMLRYVFYDCSKERVFLSSEIKYIDNFASFQQMKSNHKQNISLKSDLGLNNKEIAPMIFVPFIENAFKYSRIEETKDAYVRISIENINKKLSFIIENNIDECNKPSQGSGMGIKNVQHRLNIIYPEKHELTISEKDNKFCVELIIDI
ncbi:MAG: histidine kinase [Bacteroidetes bacterium]|nr:histidine kinase [Bacteroidota bacterium]